MVQGDKSVSDERPRNDWVPIQEVDWDALGDSPIYLKDAEGETFVFLDARQIANSIKDNGGAGSAVAVRRANLQKPVKARLEPCAPRWANMEEMPTMPRGWYWAAFPGGWEWYSPELNMTQGIFHGDVRWHSLMSKRYWGPFQAPPEN